MGNTTELRGYIYAPGECAALNAASIAALPQEDEWPYLTRDMFAVPHLSHSYNDQLIVFGSLYKNLEPRAGWPEWRTKFEALLRTIFWYDAHVYLDVELYGRCLYKWTAASATDAARHAPVTQWTFSGGVVTIDH